MKIGIVGCGGISNAHAKDLRTLIDKGEDIEVTYLADVAEEKALELKKKWGFTGARIVSDYKKMISLVDAAIICTPHTLHYEQAKAFLSEGKHVLVEKPMVCKIEHAVDLIETAEENGVVLEIAFQRHFIPTFVAARNFVREGSLGEVKMIALILAQDWYNLARRSWRGTKALGGGGELVDSGSHISDVAFWVSGLKPYEVFAFFDDYDIEVDVNTCLVAKLNNGALLSYGIAGDDPDWLDYEIFWGTEGRLLLHGNRVFFEDKSKCKVELDTSNIEPSRPVFNFIDTILGRSGNEVPPIYGLYVAALSEAAYESMVKRRPITIKELCEARGINYSKYF